MFIVYLYKTTVNGRQLCILMVLCFLLTFIKAWLTGVNRAIWKVICFLFSFTKIRSTGVNRLKRRAYVFVYFYENAFYVYFMMLFLTFVFKNRLINPDVYLSLYCFVYIFEILHSVNHKLIYTCPKFHLLCFSCNI